MAQLTCCFLILVLGLASGKNDLFINEKEGNVTGPHKQTSVSQGTSFLPILANYAESVPHVSVLNENELNETKETSNISKKVVKVKRDKRDVRYVGPRRKYGKNERKVSKKPGTGKRVENKRKEPGREKKKKNKQGESSKRKKSVKKRKEPSRDKRKKNNRKEPSKQKGKKNTKKEPRNKQRKENKKKEPKRQKKTENNRKKNQRIKPSRDEIKENEKREPNTREGKQLILNDAVTKASRDKRKKNNRKEPSTQKGKKNIKKEPRNKQRKENKKKEPKRQKKTENNRKKNQRIKPSRDEIKENEKREPNTREGKQLILNDAVTKLIEKSGNERIRNNTTDIVALKAARKSKMAAVKALEAKGGYIALGATGKLFCENTEERSENTPEKDDVYKWTDSQGNDVKGRLSVKPGGHLEVKAARDEDSGVYTCTLGGSSPVNKTLTVYLLPQFRLSVIIKYQIDTCSPEEAQAKQTQLKSSLCDQNVDCEFTHVTAHCYLFVEEDDFKQQMWFNVVIDPGSFYNPPTCNPMCQERHLSKHLDKAYQILKQKSSSLGSGAGNNMTLIPEDPMVKSLVKECPPGYMPHDVICAACKPGSSSIAGEACKLCPVSTYQPLFGAAGCHNCPIGYETTRAGALNEDMCLMPENTAPGGLHSGLNYTNKFIVIIVLIVTIVKL